MHIINVRVPVEAISIDEYVIVGDMLWKVTKIGYNRATMVRTLQLESATDVLTKDYPSWADSTVNRVILTLGN